MKNGPKFSTTTIKTAAKVGNIALSIGMEIGPARNNAEELGDMIFYMVSNGPDVCIIRCTPYAYMVEYYYDAHCGGYEADYFMIKNIRNFLLYLNKRKFVDFDVWDAKIVDSLIEEDLEIDLDEDDFDFGGLFEED